MYINLGIEILSLTLVIIIYQFIHGDWLIFPANEKKLFKLIIFF